MFPLFLVVGMLRIFSSSVMFSEISFVISWCVLILSIPGDLYLYVRLNVFIICSIVYISGSLFL